MNARGRLASAWASAGLRLALLGVASAALFNTYADLRISGPLGIGFHFEGWKPRAQREAREKAALIAAQGRAGELQRQVLAKAEQDYRDLAERTDNETDLATQVALGAADRFIAANRVHCPADRSSPGPAPAAAESGSAQGSDRSGGSAQLDAPGADMVGVADEDVRICTRNTARLKAAREWGLGLETLSDRDATPQ